MSTVIDRPDTETTTDDQLFRDITQQEEPVSDDGLGDEERFAHYVDKEDIVRSSTTGAPVFAICGKKWVPSRNPENFPICPECTEVYERMRAE